MCPFETIALFALSLSTLIGTTSVEARACIVEQLDSYPVHCSSVAASELPDVVIDRYGVREQSDITGIVSRVPQENSATAAGLSNAQAAFQGYMQTLVGHQQSLDCGAVLENEADTYNATCERTSTSPVRFSTSASADGATFQVAFPKPPQ